MAIIPVSGKDGASGMEMVGSWQPHRIISITVMRCTPYEYEDIRAGPRESVMMLTVRLLRNTRNYSRIRGEPATMCTCVPWSHCYQIGGAWQGPC